MQELGFKEMSQTEQKLNYAQKDWDYDTRNLQKDDNALQLIIKNKLQKHFKNTPAKEALMRLREEVRENRLRYNEMKRLWNAKDLKQTATLCAVNEFIKNQLGTKAQNITISAKMMHDHKNPKVTRANTHLEIGAFDYSLIPFMLNESNILGIFKDKNNANNIHIVASKLNYTYRLALADKGETMSVASLLSDKKEKQNILERLKNNKKIIYLKSKNSVGDPEH